MSISPRWARIGDWLWLLTFGVLSSAGCWATAWTIGATFDEPLYFAESLNTWRTGSHAGLMRVGTMPLPIDVHGLPLYIWERYRGTPIDLAQDMVSLLPWFRLGNLAFWWVLLIYGRLVGRMLAGPWAGRLAVAMLACEPTLLAHASLGTTDVSLAACLLALAYHFRAGRAGHWPRRVGLPAFWYGAAILAKASGLVFGPLCMVVIELERLMTQDDFSWPERGKWREWRADVWGRLQLLRRDLAVILGAGLALTFVYCGTEWQPLPSFIQWASTIPDGDTRTRFVWLAEHLTIFSNAGEALVRQVAHNMRGHGVYLLGQTARRSFWYYFPLALTMKLTVPLLLTPLVVLLFRWRALRNWALATAAVLLLFSLNCRVQIGVRLVLPLVIFLTVGVAAALVQAIRTLEPGWRRRVLAASAAAGLVWSAFAAVQVWPNWLCYTNELWGGTENGYLCLSDSNYDWGQGVPDLARWLQERPGTPMSVFYFGSDPALRRLPARYIHASQFKLQDAEDVRALLRGSYVAINTTLLHGSYGTGPQETSLRAVLAFLRMRTPVARTTTFLIFDLQQE